MKNGFIKLTYTNEKRVEKLLDECLQMLDAMKKDSMLRKIYSDVDFVEIVESINEWKEAKEIVADWF